MNKVILLCSECTTYDWSKLMSTWFPLIVLGVGAILAFHQIKYNFRLRWVEEFRSSIALYCSLVNDIAFCTVKRNKAAELFEDIKEGNNVEIVNGVRMTKLKMIDKLDDLTSKYSIESAKLGLFIENIDVKEGTIDFQVLDILTKIKTEINGQDNTDKLEENIFKLSNELIVLSRKLIKKKINYWN